MYTVLIADQNANLAWPGCATRYTTLEISDIGGRRNAVYGTPGWGYTHHASADDPQYEIKSDKTDHVAIHKGKALHKIE